ncbi:MAG: 4-hydroxy-tetrahydrodipicolinate synthase [Alphaproteobacteria bacterium MarineAlpha6_Bin4]|nr:MAG: 4-hydroxy-tetrahydrodipicolinate synthase [Alphaproteobacteria bacterium MarineAlpha6_Bin3]PPR37130.1 MAG: 4-hydroxy-tetrahydrodipicolinate synthase [Alphaproteobacteria bacterium MarineAlpha6_Bin4]|tara:strand:- start:2627 stop:3511 length:885 start_codon:yes stop_codon:yes gene_type:complete
MFKGSITALITPLKNGKIDEKAFQDFVEWQINQGSHGLVPCGTTGESPTLDHDEHERVIDLCIEASNRRVPVIAGTGSNSTHEAISLTNYSKEAGADAVLIVTPYYNKPTQEGLYHHFKSINDSCDIPIIIYNIPGRSVVDISIETMKKLSKLKNIIGVKDSTNDLSRPLLISNEIGSKFCQISGEDATVLPFLSQGGQGCISVTANIAPKLCSDLHNAWQKNNFKKAQLLNSLLFPLHNALFLETSPGPVKYAASLLKICSDELRLPLVGIANSTKKEIKSVINKLKIKPIKK